MVRLGKSEVEELGDWMSCPELSEVDAPPTRFDGVVPFVGSALAAPVGRGFALGPVGPAVTAEAAPAPAARARPDGRRRRAGPGVRGARWAGRRRRWRRCGALGNGAYG